MVLISHNSAWKIEESSFLNIIKLFMCGKLKCGHLYVFLNVISHQIHSSCLKLYFFMNTNSLIHFNPERCIYIKVPELLCFSRIFNPSYSLSLSLSLSRLETQIVCQTRWKQCHSREHISPCRWNDQKHRRVENGQVGKTGTNR